MLLAIVVGFCLSLAHYYFFMCLLAFFLTSSKATKYEQEVKGKVEEDFKEGGGRNWPQVLCNGGMAFELSLLYLLDIGSDDLHVDFCHQYRASWLGMAVLGAVSCCNGDTWASELGTVLAKGDFTDEEGLKHLFKKTIPIKTTKSVPTIEDLDPSKVIANNRNLSDKFYKFKLPSAGPSLFPSKVD